MIYNNIIIPFVFVFISQSPFSFKLNINAQIKSHRVCVYNTRGRSQADLKSFEYRWW